MTRLRSDITLIARARRKLARWPDLAYEATHDSLHIPAPQQEGFDIRLHGRGTRHTVRFDGWVRTFDRDDDALDCLELGLSDSCRLAVTLRGSTPVSWLLEVREYGLWVPHRRTRRRLVPFWRAPRVEYRQNVVITRA